MAPFCPPNRPRDDHYPSDGPSSTVERRFFVEGTENEPISHNTAEPIGTRQVSRTQRRRMERERARRKRAAEQGGKAGNPSVRTAANNTTAATDDAENAESGTPDRLLPGQCAYVDLPTGTGEPWTFQRVPLTGTVIKAGDVAQILLECPDFSETHAQAWAACWAESRLAGEYGGQAQAEQRALQRILLQEVRTGRALDPPQPRMKQLTQTMVCKASVRAVQDEHPAWTVGQAHAVAAIGLEYRGSAQILSVVGGKLQEQFWYGDHLARPTGSGQ